MVAKKKPVKKAVKKGTTTAKAVERLIKSTRKKKK